MELRKFVSATRQKVASAIDGVKRFARLERVLAMVCISIPALLILFDDGQIRNSISEYYDMAKARSSTSL